MSKKEPIKSKGVLYHVFDSYEFVDECIYSLKTFKKFHPSIPATLFTNLEIKKPHQKYFEKIIKIDVKLPIFVYKVYCLQQSPYEYTLYLDGDTEIRQSVQELFDFLEYYDFLFTRAIEFDFTKEPWEFLSYMDEKHCNAGVMLFRKSESTKKFIEKWFEISTTIQFERVIGEKKFMSFDDQMALNYLVREKCYPDEIKMRVLFLPGKIYNAVTYAFGQLKKDNQLRFIKIGHGHEFFRRQLIKRIKEKLAILKNKYISD